MIEKITAVGRVFEGWVKKVDHPIVLNDTIKDETQLEHQRHEQISQWLHPFSADCIHKHLRLLGSGIYNDKYQIIIDDSDISQLRIIHPTFHIDIKINSSSEYSLWVTIQSEKREEFLPIIISSPQWGSAIKWVVEDRTGWINLLYSELSTLISELPQFVEKRDRQRLSMLKEERERQSKYEREYLNDIITNMEVN